MDELKNKEFRALYAPDYHLLAKSEKERLIAELAAQYGLKIKGFQEFCRFGKSIYTAILEKDGSEFVFVPGAKIRLGWQGKAEDFSRETLEDMADTFLAMEESEDEDMDEWDDEKIEQRIAAKIKEPAFLKQITDYFNEYTSEPEEVLIHPLFVERYYQESCWETVEQTEIAKHKNWLEAAHQAEANCSYIEIDQEVRLWLNGKDIKAKQYREISFEQLKQQVEEEGYFLPTRREWEYFAGGGCDTLFAWGNDMDFSLVLRNINDFGLAREEKIYSLEESNFFGLVLAHDPYEREIVYDEQFSYKGGDGGCNVCGGLGMVLGYFPASPYYQDPQEEMGENVNGGFDFFRKVIRIA
ncbi:hypothetical protein EII17_00035 [Clostridiales bacterium COT073_COT-073]|nr:hypothetical protein EII17_00035 [Clostridiales bacterium COT073_COT-073]